MTSSPLELLLEQSLRAYCALTNLDALFAQADDVGTADFEAALNERRHALADAADLYRRYADGFVQALSAPGLIDRVLLHYLDGNASAEDLERYRSEIADGIRNARQCRGEADRLKLTAEAAGWPPGAPETWATPLDIPTAFLAIAAQEALAKATSQDDVVRKTLGTLVRADFSIEEKRARREQFISRCKPIIMRTRWQVIASCTRGRDTDLLRAMKHGLVVLAPNPPPSSQN